MIYHLFNEDSSLIIKKKKKPLNQVYMMWNSTLMDHTTQSLHAQYCN